MIERLQQLGLSEKESHTYQALVKLGESTANEIAKQTSTNRTVTYNVLQGLVEKSLISYVKKEGRRIYRVAKPEALLTTVKEKEDIAKDLITDINKFKTIPSSFKNVEIYEGLQGMKIIFDEIRNAKGLRVINATGKIFEHLKYSAGHIVKDIELHGAKTIANQSMKKTPLSKYNFKVKYLPKEAENYATTFIFKNKVIIQVLKDKPFLIKIENKEIYDGYRKDFDVLWSKL
ncbi:MAG: helix-turn-helix domain-containing protein [archaeon]